MSRPADDDQPPRRVEIAALDDNRRRSTEATFEPCRAAFSAVGASLVREVEDVVAVEVRGGERGREPVRAFGASLDGGAVLVQD